MFCTKCGHKHDNENMAFCTKCGTQQATGMTPNPFIASRNTRASNKKPILIICAAAVAVIVVLIAVFSFGGGGIPNGRFYFDSIITEVGFAIPPHGFFEFRGNNVTVSNPILLHDTATVRYTYSQGVMRLQYGGRTIEYGIEVVDRDTLIITLAGIEFRYVRRN